MLAVDPESVAQFDNADWVDMKRNTGIVTK